MEIAGLDDVAAASSIASFETSIAGISPSKISVPKGL